MSEIAVLDHRTDPAVAAPSHVDVDTDLRRLGDLVGGYERHMLELVQVVDRISRSGLVEELEGLPVEQVLALRFNLTRGEVWMLQTTGECLRDMPAVKRMWRDGVVSWSQVRQIVDGAKRLPREHRRILDARLAASQDLLDAMDPDRLAWAVDKAVDELRGLKSVRDAERQAEKANFISVQQDFDGGGRFYGEADPVSMATMVDSWDAAANDLEAAGQDVPSKPSQRRAVGAVAVAGDYLAGGPRPTDVDDSTDGDDSTGGEDSTDGGGRPRGPRKARPLVNFIVDVADCTTTAAGQIMLDASGALPTVTRTKLARILESDHDCRVVLFDGGRPLAVSDVVGAERMPDKTRIAVKVRDRGGRMPGSRTPAGQTHLHHLDKERFGHHPDHLVSLGPFGHLKQVHKRGWKLHLDPDTGQVTALWRDRTYRSVPWGTHLRRAPDNDDEDGPA